MPAMRYLCVPDAVQRERAHAGLLGRARAWLRANGAPLHRAIVWQDRRTADRCDALRAAGHEPTIRRLTGLVLDPYFSATKLSWLLQNVRGAREKAEAGQLAFGTIDCYLAWRLTGGAAHVTDVSNASRCGRSSISRRSRRVAGSARTFAKLVVSSSAQP